MQRKRNELAEDGQITKSTTAVQTDAEILDPYTKMARDLYS